MLSKYLPLKGLLKFKDNIYEDIQDKLYHFLESDRNSICIVMPPKTGITTILTQYLIPNIIVCSIVEESEYAYCTYNMQWAATCVDNIPIKLKGKPLSIVTGPIANINFDYIFVDNPLWKYNKEVYKLKKGIEYLKVSLKEHAKLIMLTNNFIEMDRFKIYDEFDEILFTSIYDYPKLYSFIDIENLRISLPDEEFRALYERR